MLGCAIMKPTIIYLSTAILAAGALTAPTASAADSMHELFQDKCRMCHESYRDVARIKLTLKDGRLVGLYTGRDMLEFMAGHGRLTAAEVPAVVTRMARDLTAAAGGPGPGLQIRRRGR